MFGESIGAYFDSKSLQEIKCGVTLTNIANISAAELPTTLEVLTSQPEKLTEEDIEQATEVLLAIENEPDQEVIVAFF